MRRKQTKKKRYIICMIKNVYFFVQSLNQLLGPIDRKAQKCKQETKTI